MAPLSSSLLFRFSLFWFPLSSLLSSFVASPTPRLPVSWGLTVVVSCEMSVKGEAETEMLDVAEAESYETLEKPQALIRSRMSTPSQLTPAAYGKVLEHTLTAITIVYIVVIVIIIIVFIVPAPLLKVLLDTPLALPRNVGDVEAVVLADALPL